ncbi:MBOAT family O-acyltransferase [Agriterribacter sp.]|uniref:MBOAT family O-acyltransferase n=1 Tax=Agriterribacter sp. TaxID=2821509 RepID=UPI002BBCE3D5|nr:MBOAT family O-acyltransferase [Agriterribacter sp.]HRP54767.1 MBOAT family O-acyltransferase [Agriterribacter sp.]
MSYLFYSFWDWRFLFLLAFSTFLDFFTGLRISNATSAAKRKTWLFISVFVNLGFLGFFKYYNFFIESFADLLGAMGLKAHLTTLNIILPVGISFYTFHGLSYVFDIYNNKIRPTTNWIDYALFVSFFPLLVAGPIERATHLLPQVEKIRTFDYPKMVDGLRQILWGLFKKIVIADTCAEYVNLIFNNSESYSGGTLILGAVLFAFQIYGDFSGYTDIALGTARLLGFELLRNFAYPYFSRDIAEFWRRWHISLSTWFRDYLYIPLGGSRGGVYKKIRNILIIFLVSGFWHGANWTFIVWGLLNAIYIMPSVILKTNRNHLDIVASGKLLPSIKEAVQLVVTFALTTFAWIFFRANDLHHALSYISGIFSHDLFSIPFLTHPELFKSIICIMLIAVFLVVEWIGRSNKYAIEKIGQKQPTLVRWTFYYAVVFSILLSYGKNQEFIYFQF